jgi:uncharacterized protein YndB with AHSA1/START domain
MTADKFETTFSISAAPDVVWNRLDQRDEDGRWLLPAFEAQADEVDVEPGTKLHVRKVTEPCAGSEIVIVLEHEGSGTKVTVAQSGFPAWFATATDAFAVGWRHIVADLALYLDRGVRGGRHARPWRSSGARFARRSSGSKSWTSCPERSRPPSASRRATSCSPSAARRSSCGPSSRQ